MLLWILGPKIGSTVPVEGVQVLGTHYLPRVPAHPLRALGVCALGSDLGDNGVKMYHNLLHSLLRDCVPRRNHAGRIIPVAVDHVPLPTHSWGHVMLMCHLGISHLQLL